MRRIVILIGAIVMVLVVHRAFCSPPKSSTLSSSIDAPNMGHSTETGSIEDLATGKRWTRDEISMGLPPRLTQVDDVPTVVYERGPRRPDEHPDHYRDRVRFAKNFDAFVRESGVTEAQVQKLLLAMYDFIEQRKYLWAILRQDVNHGVDVDAMYVQELFSETVSQLMQAEQSILTWPQRNVFLDHCMGCARRLATAEYDEPVLRLEGEP